MTIVSREIRRHRISLKKSLGFQPQDTTPEWGKKREIIRALVKRVEVDKEEIRVIYRIPPQPFALTPGCGSVLD